MAAKTKPAAEQATGNGVPSPEEWERAQAYIKQLESRVTFLQSQQEGMIAQLDGSLKILKAGNR